MSLKTYLNLLLRYTYTYISKVIKLKNIICHKSL